MTGKANTRRNVLATIERVEESWGDCKMERCYYVGELGEGFCPKHYDFYLTASNTTERKNRRRRVNSV